MKNIDYKKVGKKMQSLRKAHGYTQEQIAEKINTTAAFISNVENNKTKANLKILLSYSRLLDVSIEYFLETEPLETNSSVLDTEILRLIHDFTNETKEKLIEMLRVYKR